MRIIRSGHFPIVHARGDHRAFARIAWDVWGGADGEPARVRFRFIRKRSLDGVLGGDCLPRSFSVPHGKFDGADPGSGEWNSRILDLIMKRCGCAGGVLEGDSLAETPDNHEVLAAELRGLADPPVNAVSAGGPQGGIAAKAATPRR